MFLTFAKKEVVIRTSAKITANACKLEVPIDTKIIENQLVENKEVKKGEKLVTFDAQNLQLQKAPLETENEQISKEKESAQRLIDSLNTDSNQFQQPDPFGYEDQLKSILSENTANQLEIEKKKLANQKEQEAYQKANNQLTKQLQSYKNQVTEWEQVRTAWQNQQSLQGFPTEIMTEYQAWQTQVKEVSEEQKEQTKASITLQINERITQIKSMIEQLENEQVKLVEPTSIEPEIQKQTETYIQIKEQAITATKQKIKELSSTENKNKQTIQLLNEQIQQAVIKAPITGKIHLNDEVKGLTEIPTGTVIAEIYPALNKEKQLFTAYIPSSDMTRVKVNMPVHLKIDNKGVKTEILNGKLTQIAETSTPTEKGDFYLVKGTISIPKKLDIRYGITGELSLIIGKKTYLQQIKDWIFNE
ncbi:iron ABC transporter ATPase [Enterococcus xinjiangensis]|nr:iron ABC transporter ATPase [Enterococcus lactis]